MVRGRVLDAETGQALPFIKVYLYEAGEQAGEALLTRLDGRFEAPRQGKRLRLRFRDGLTGAYLGNVPVPSASDEVVFEAEVGPTLIVRLSGAPQERMDWFVRLVDPGKSPYSTEWSLQHGVTILFREYPESYGLELPSRAFPDRAQPGAWTWLSPKLLEPDGVLVARYGLQEELARAPGSALAIQVIEQKEVWQGERRIESALGVISSEIAVEPKCVLLSGRVVDEDGNAVGAEVVAFPRGPRDSSSPPARVASTGLEGAWTMKDLPPGPARVLVFSANRPVERVDVELALGAQEPLDIVLPRAARSRCERSAGQPRSRRGSGRDRLSRTYGGSCLGSTAVGAGEALHRGTRAVFVRGRAAGRASLERDRAGWPQLHALTRANRRGWIRGIHDAAA